MGRKISKRTFIKTCACGVGTIAVGLSGMDALANQIERRFPDPLVPEMPVRWKWSREAMHYTETPRGLKCQLCPNACLIKEGDTSMCRTRMVEKGKMYTIVFGNPCSVHVDPVEKKPLFHFLPSSTAYSFATAGCTLACLYCQNWEISQASPLDTRNTDLMPQNAVDECEKNDCRSIAYTYAEPVAFYEYTLETSKIARNKGIKNILVSNGFIQDKPIRELAKYLDAANITLKSFNDETYQKMCGGALNPVLNTLKALKETNVWLEITCLIVPGWTDDLEQIRNMCAWFIQNGFSDTPVHFNRFFPEYKLKQLPATPLSTLEKARNIALSAGMNYVYIGNIPGTNYENTTWPHCKKTVVERKGFVMVSNNIVAGKCKYCKTAIAGHWA